MNTTNNTINKVEISIKLVELKELFRLDIIFILNRIKLNFLFPFIYLCYSCFLFTRKQLLCR